MCNIKHRRELLRRRMLFKLYFLEVGEKGKYLNRCLICKRPYYSEKHNSVINEFHTLFLSRSRSVPQHLTCASSGWLLCSSGLIETVLTLNLPKYSHKLPGKHEQNRMPWLPLAQTAKCSGGFCGCLRGISGE